MYVLGLEPADFKSIIMQLIAYYFSYFSMKYLRNNGYLDMDKIQTEKQTKLTKKKYILIEVILYSFITFSFLYINILIISIISIGLFCSSVLITFYYGYKQGLKE